MNVLRAIPKATSAAGVIAHSRLTRVGKIPGFFIPPNIVKNEMAEVGCEQTYQRLMEQYAIDDGALVSEAVNALKGLLGGLVGVEPYNNPSDMYPNKFVYNGTTITDPEEHVDMCNTGFAAHLQLHTPNKSRSVELSSYFGPKPKIEGELLTQEVGEVYTGSTMPGQITIFRGYPSQDDSTETCAPATLHKFSGHGEWLRIGW